jgi:hypothetical protein
MGEVMSTGPRYVNTSVPPGLLCEDCGVMIGSQEAHTRFHGIMSSWALALAILRTSHIAAHVHDKYDVDERIMARENRVRIVMREDL